MKEGAIDPIVIRRHLIALNQAMQRLRLLQNTTAAELTTNPDRLWIVERGLQLAIQNVVDIATHICARMGLDVANYAGAIDGLQKLGVLEPAFAHAFRSVAGLRNLLVHGYLAIDPARLARALNERLDDFVIFSQCIERFVDAQNKAPDDCAS